MIDFGIEVGEKATFAKTIGESDIYLFAGITGDFSPNHVNDQFMKKSDYGQRIAHGLLTLALSSTTSTMVAARSLAKSTEYFPVSLGYDHVRFLKPVFIGDTLTVNYEIVDLNPETFRSRSKIEVVNQHGEIVMVGEHIMKWVK
jgi:3-hydroxybutyryl-CoA dehydratase